MIDLLEGELDLLYDPPIAGSPEQNLALEEAVAKITLMMKRPP
ncbi:MAG: hypothetical protein ABI334_07660 [Candidatus Dormiibacterota bacterium]